MTKKKVVFASFQIAKWGGIIEEVENRAAAYKAIDYDVEIIRLTYNKDENEKRFKTQIRSLDSGEYFKGMKIDSQRGGMEKSQITGFWKNSYYGWILPPFTNRIPVFHPDALEMWHKAVKDADIIFWSFMPTKTGESEGFSDWWKYFDLPSTTKQVFIVHDGYFDKRSAWVTALKDKILFLEPVHLAAFYSCENIGIPRRLCISPRMFPEKPFNKPMSERKVDFFCAHIFKSMKKMDEMIRAIPHLGSHGIFKTIIGGADIEYNYMTSETKTKSNYLVNKNSDPDVDEDFYGMKIWDLGIAAGMDYVGMLGKSQMTNYYQNSKFFIDPSWSTHYAQYNRTNINSSLIEATINGCYPIVRDYKGLEKEKFYDDDEIFNELKAIVIPWDVTPKQFAKYLVDGLKKLDDKTYKKHVESNFELFRRYAGAKENVETELKIIEEGDADTLVLGEDSEEVLLQTFDVMENYFGIKLPIQWEN